MAIILDVDETIKELNRLKKKGFKTVCMNHGTNFGFEPDHDELKLEKSDHCACDNDD